MEENADLRFKIKTLEERIRLLESHIIALGSESGIVTPCTTRRSPTPSSSSSLAENVTREQSSLGAIIPPIVMPPSLYHASASNRALAATHSRNQ